MNDRFLYYMTKPVVSFRFVTNHYKTSTYPLISMSHNNDIKPYQIREYRWSTFPHDSCEQVKQRNLHYKNYWYDEGFP